MEPKHEQGRAQAHREAEAHQNHEDTKEKQETRQVGPADLGGLLSGDLQTDTANQPLVPGGLSISRCYRAARKLGRRGGLVSGQRRRVRRHGSPIPKPSMPSVSVQAEEIRRPPPWFRPPRLPSQRPQDPQGTKGVWRVFEGVLP